MDIKKEKKAVRSTSMFAILLLSIGELSLKETDNIRFSFSI